MNQPKRLRRAESFLGLHFDFHAGDDCTEVGRNVTREMVKSIIDLVHPDYIQCDCKGHPGLSSYPTEVGHQAPGFVRDQLRIWREVTAEHGVALFMHYSGVWDMEAIRRHPSWARVDENGRLDDNNTSVFGPYVDELLIPQMKELSDDYGVDGAWMDGECWAVAPDYAENVVQRFQAESGIAAIPKTPDDPGFFEFREFCRECFRQYLRHYVDELHRHNPNFQIASNWAFTSFMPEPVSANVDFISGDYPLQDSVNVARLEARCIAGQGMPWDLMAWGFSGKLSEDAWTTKNVVQLQQEAAVVLALGGGFQTYFTQNRDGSIRDWVLKPMAEVAKFCRARQHTCHKAEPVHQIGLVYSGKAYYRRKTGSLFAPYSGELAGLTGVLHALLDAQNSVEIVMEHQLENKLADYPVIIVPEWDYLDPEFTDDLRQYVMQGGNLLLIGPQATALFADELDVCLESKPEKAKKWLEHDGWLGSTPGLFQHAVLGKKAQAVGKLYCGDGPNGPFEVAAAITACGKGKIAGVFINLGERYRNARVPLVRDFLNALVRELSPDPMVEVTGSHYVDVMVARNNGNLIVNLVNTAGPHQDSSVHAYDEVPPLGPLSVTIRTNERPSRITRQPSGEEMPFRFESGMVRLTVPRLELHDILVVRGVSQV